MPGCGARTEFGLALLKWQAAQVYENFLMKRNNPRGIASAILKNQTSSMTLRRNIVRDKNGPPFSGPSKGRKTENGRCKSKQSTKIEKS